MKSNTTPPKSKVEKIQQKGAARVQRIVSKGSDKAKGMYAKAEKLESKSNDAATAGKTRKASVLSSRSEIAKNNAKYKNKLTVGKVKTAMSNTDKKVKSAIEKSANKPPKGVMTPEKLQNRRDFRKVAGGVASTIITPIILNRKKKQ